MTHDLFSLCVDPRMDPRLRGDDVGVIRSFSLLNSARITTRSTVEGAGRSGQVASTV